MLTLWEMHEILSFLPPYKQNYSKRFLEFSREKRAQNHTSQQANKKVKKRKAGQAEERRDNSKMLDKTTFSLVPDFR